MMLYYRTDLFEQLGLDGAEDLGRVRRGRRAACAQKDPKQLPDHVLRPTTRAGSPGSPSRPARQWWGVNGEPWTVGDQRRRPRRRSPTTGAAWSHEGVVDDQPMYTPEWNKRAQRRHPARPGRARSGARACWPATPRTPRASGRWRRCRSGTPARTPTGIWGGSSHRGRRRSPSTRRRPREFATWLNTDPAADRGAGQGGRRLPGGDRRPVRPGAGPSRRRSSPNQPDFYADADADRRAPPRGFTWGPNVNVTYSAYKDAFGKAITEQAAVHRRARHDAGDHRGRHEEERLQGQPSDGDARRPTAHGARRRAVRSSCAPAIVLFVAVPRSLPIGVHRST